MTSPITRTLLTRMSILLLTGIAAGCASPAQKQFKSPQDAAAALVGALETNNTPELKKIFGPDSDSLISSGDPVADHAERQRFLAEYEQKHAVVPGEGDAMVIEVGDKDWPMPIPIVKQKNAWVFDTAAGKDEIICRRIGRNELATIQVCLAIVDAEQEYALRDPNGSGVHEYAQKFFSDPGKKDGLYWQTTEGEPPSPLGQLVASAAEEGYTHNANPAPYHGYRFGLLKSQGASAPGGAVDYVLNGKMIGGFAALAFPAEYGSSGIMTFIVDHDGVVFQKDLGPDTEKAAEAMKSFDPDSTWTKVNTNENADR
jgi:hypothetical protein